MRVGIITVLYKSDSVLDAFIECLNEQDFKEFEVYFLENDVNSTVCEKKINDAARFDYHFRRNSDNTGVAAGNNYGIEYFSKVDSITHLLFLNNDIEIASTFLSDHKGFFDEHSNVDALAPKMYYHDAGGKIWYAGGTLSYIKCGPIHFGHNKPDLLTKKKLYRVSYAPTCSVMVKKDLIESNMIRMREELFVYYDDYVFCVDLKKAGIKLFYTPTIELQHKISSSTGGSESEFSRYYSTRNWAYLVRTYRNISFLLLPFLFVKNKLLGRLIENKAIRDSLVMAR